MTPTSSPAATPRVQPPRPAIVMACFARRQVERREVTISRQSARRAALRQSRNRSRPAVHRVQASGSLVSLSAVVAEKRLPPGGEGLEQRLLVLQRLIHLGAHRRAQASGPAAANAACTIRCLARRTPAAVASPSLMARSTASRGPAIHDAQQAVPTAQLCPTRRSTSAGAARTRRLALRARRKAGCRTRRGPRRASP